MKKNILIAGLVILVIVELGFSSLLHRAYRYVSLNDKGVYADGVYYKFNNMKCEGNVCIPTFEKENN